MKIKNTFLFLLALAGASVSLASYHAMILGGGKIVSHTKVDSVKQFSFQKGVLNKANVDGTDSSYALTDVDSMTFVSDTVFVTYNGNSATIVNPLASYGLKVTADNADVTAVSDTNVQDIKDVVYVLRGSSSTGSFYVSSSKRFVLMLDNLSLKNDKGAAIASLIDKEMMVEVIGADTLADGLASEHVGADTTYNAALWSKGQMILKGSGSLAVSGNYGHGICSKDYVQIDGGNLYITTKSGDAIHANDYFRMNGGYIGGSSIGADGIDAGDSVVVNGGAINLLINTIDSKAIKSDGNITINKCDSINIVLNGAADRGIKSGTYLPKGATDSIPADINILGGKIKIVLNNVGQHTVDNESTSGAGIKSDGKINMANATVDIYADSSSKSIKGVTADGDISIDSTSDVVVIVSCKSGKTWGFKSDVIYITGKVLEVSGDALTSVLATYSSSIPVSFGNPSQFSGSYITTKKGRVVVLYYLLNSKLKDSESGSFSNIPQFK